jgi:hypothetical protein
MAATGDHIQNPNSPLRDPERLAAEFGLPYKKKKRRWNVTEDGFARTSDAGKGDHARGQSPEELARYKRNYVDLDWNNYPEEDRCPARNADEEPTG